MKIAEGANKKLIMHASVDLVQGAFAHLEFLRTVDDYPCLFEGPYLKQALQRYETLWLPLAAENSTEILAAPLDIEWAWHCHILAPHFYRKDCKAVYGKLINHKLLRSSERIERLPRSRELWEKKYPNETV
ncbi:hypothetical protein KUTeg_021079 [Tegillarca granosa]|uniref:Uncharacterized protein n=1 Tax=Tegillarca granosa TaxID=220873 RepID=A0ABQ9E9V1_TEGGR|nr:hypothetical protein KUTeg_021079 [Tegillarca granosa]